MKKIIISSILLSSIILGNQLTYFPVGKNILSEENGGTLKAIDAYSDGVGFVSYGKFNIDNNAMNTLVFKYGEESKNNNESLKNYVLSNTNNEEDINNANKLGNLALNLTPNDGTSCDDNNDLTINDIYVNGTCIGENVEGQTCNDNNTSTFYDKYVNGVCVGNSWITSTLPVLTTVYTNMAYNATTKTWSSTGQFGNIFFNATQTSGLKKIEFSMTQTSGYGMSLYISSKPANVNLGNSCAYANTSDETLLNFYDQNYVLTIDYDNRKYWVQTKTYYSDNVTGTKYNFNSTWTKSNLAFFIQDCTSSGTGTFKINSIQSVQP